MASSTGVDSSATQTNNSNPPNGPSRGSGSRGRSRGGRGHRSGTPNTFTPGDNRPHSARGSGRGGRGGRRGEYSAHGRQTFDSTELLRNPPSAALKPPPPDLGGGGTSGTRPTEDAKNEKGEGGVGTGKGKGVSAVSAETPEEEEAEVCFICASVIVHQSVAPCNHRTCHICALRMRALYKTRACAHCRTESRYVVFTDDEVKRFEDFGEGDFEAVDENLGIKYEKQLIHDDTTLLLQYNCPSEDCETACFGWPDIHRHVQGVHGKFLCKLCTKFKKVFTHEHELFTKEQLRKHEKFGDDNPGAVDQSGFKGHPECGFCRIRYYGDDELFQHCRERHETCFICERRNNSRNASYYQDYRGLEAHFKAEHFMCPDTECLEKKFIVFASEMDFKAHQLEAHPKGMSKDARRDARLVDISGFDYRAPYESDRRRRGGGRGRDPNTDALPPSSAQPMRRDELAFQRQMAIQSAQSSSARTFGGQLTSSSTSTLSPAQGGGSPPTVTAPKTGNTTNSDTAVDSTLSQVQQLDIGSTASTTDGPISLQQQARQIQHQAVVDRASQLLKNEPTKLSDFRSRVSAYKNSAISATELIESFFTLFDAPSEQVGKLIRELAQIYENETKRTELLKAYNDWRAINEDYPTLPGPNGITPSAAPSVSGRRILKLKSSTAQSSRSAVSKQASWGTVAAASSQPFPALSANRVGAGRVGPVAWAGATAPAKRVSPANSRPASAAPNSRQGPPVQDAFPHLPAAAAPSVHILGKHRGTVAWGAGRATPQTGPWGAPSTKNPSEDHSDLDRALAESLAADGAGAGKKKKQGKKEVLYKFG